MAKQRGKYLRELKLKLLRQINESEKTASEQSRDLGLSRKQVSRWRQQLAAKSDDAFPGSGRQRGAAAKLARLRTENERLKEQNEILKIGRRVFRQGRAVKHAFIRSQQGCYPVKRLCAVLDVSPSAYYGWLQQPLSARARADQSLARVLQRLHYSFRQAYGTRWLQRALRAEGLWAGRGRIRRLKRQVSLWTLRRRQAWRHQQAHPRPIIQANRVNRQFAAAAPNQVSRSATRQPGPDNNRAPACFRRVNNDARHNGLTGGKGHCLAE